MFDDAFGVTTIYLGVIVKIAVNVSKRSTGNTNTILRGLVPAMFVLCSNKDAHLLCHWFEPVKSEAKPQLRVESGARSGFVNGAACILDDGDLLPLAAYTLSQQNVGGFFAIGAGVQATAVLQSVQLVQAPNFEEALEKGGGQWLLMPEDELSLAKLQWEGYVQDVEKAEKNEIAAAEAVRVQTEKGQPTVADVAAVMANATKKAPGRLGRLLPLRMWVHPWNF